MGTFSTDPYGRGAPRPVVPGVLRTADGVAIVRPKAMQGPRKAAGLLKLLRSAGVVRSWGADTEITRACPAAAPASLIVDHQLNGQHGQLAQATLQKHPRCHAQGSQGDQGDQAASQDV